MVGRGVTSAAQKVGEVGQNVVEAMGRRTATRWVAGDRKAQSLQKAVVRMMIQAVHVVRVGDQVGKVGDQADGRMEDTGAAGVGEGA